MINFQYICKNVNLFTCFVQKCGVSVNFDICNDCNFAICIFFAKKIAIANVFELFREESQFSCSFLIERRAALMFLEYRGNMYSYFHKLGESV